MQLRTGLVTRRLSLTYCSRESVSWRYGEGSHGHFCVYLTSPAFWSEPFAISLSGLTVGFSDLISLSHSCSYKKKISSLQVCYINTQTTYSDKSKQPRSLLFPTKKKWYVTKIGDVGGGKYRSSDYYCTVISEAQRS